MKQLFWMAGLSAIAFGCSSADTSKLTGPIFCSLQPFSVHCVPMDSVLRVALSISSTPESHSRRLSCQRFSRRPSSQKKRVQTRLSWVGRIGRFGETGVGSDTRTSAPAAATAIASSSHPSAASTTRSAIVN
jgi:hypothetical protein